MSIRKIEKETLDKFKPGWRKDRRTGRWVTYEIDYYDPESGLRKRRRGFHTEQEALEFEKNLLMSAELKRLGIVSQHKDYPSIRDVLYRRLADLPNRRAKVRATTVFRSFLGTMPDGMTCDMLRTKHYKDFAENRLAAGVKPETVNREAAMVMSALKQAHINFPVLEGWTPPKGFYAEGDKRRKKERVITRAEEEKVLAWLYGKGKKTETEKDRLARLRAGLTFEFALLTGLRHGEIVGIKKAEVTDRDVSVWRPKTKVWTTFPLTPEMRAIIDRASELFDGEYVFSRHGKVHGRTWSTLRRACEAVGVPWGREGGIVLHTARHTFITRLLQAGVDIATIQSFSSHSDREMVMKYSHATETTRKKALGLLGEKERDALTAIWEAVKEGEMDLKTFLQKVSIY